MEGGGGGGVIWISVVRLSLTKHVQMLRWIVAARHLPSLGLYIVSLPFCPLTLEDLKEDFIHGKISA